MPAVAANGITIEYETGQATAAAVPGAQLRIIPGMGHDIPVPLHAEFAGLLAAHFATA
jgi:pimeloyl-ACP methyl ester carboxylesterase